MNEKHLLWHIFKYLGDLTVYDMIGDLENKKTMFSENPQPGEISVAKALEERHDAYVKARQNGR